jgi:hypothetical protein
MSFITRTVPVLMLVMGLATPAAAAPDYGTLAATLRAEIAQPGYASLAERGKALNVALHGACKASPVDVAKAEAAFNDAMDAWQGVQMIRHGAVLEADRHARLQFWPDKRDIASRHLRRLLAGGTAEELTPKSFAEASVAIQGFQALERLVFDEPGLAAAPADGNALSTCAVAEAIGGNIAVIAGGLADAAKTAGAGGKSENQVREYLSDLATELEVISDMKLTPPLGEQRPRPRLAENWRAQRSLRNVEMNLMALRDLYRTLAGDQGDDPEHALILSQFDQALAAVRANGRALTPLLDGEAGQTQLKALNFQVRSLRESILVKLTAHLGINLGFNALDGD